MAAADSTITLKVDGKPLTPWEIRGRIAVCEPLVLDVEALETSKTAKKASELLGKSFELHVQTRFGHPLVVHGIVAACERFVAVAGARYRLELASEVVAPLDLGSDCRVYQEMAADDAIKDVISRAKMDAHVRWDTKASYGKRAYIAQYNESDWAFVQRLCAEEGIYWYFDCLDAETKLVFADDSTAASDIDGGAAVTYREETRLSHEADCAFDLDWRAAVATSKVSIDDYDPKKPLLSLDADFSDGKDGFEAYDFPGRYEDKGRGTTLATMALGGRRARRYVFAGAMSGTRIRPGRKLAIHEHPVDKANATLFCTAIDVEFLGDEAGGGGPGELRCAWTAIPIATHYRPPPRPAARTMPGPQTGVVCGPSGKELHTNDTGQIRVQFFWDRVGKRDDKASTWMRVGQFAVGNSMVVPRPQWEVIVEHHNGDSDRPFTVEHLYDGKFRVPYALPANKTRTSWQTATTPGDGTSNEIRFEDSKGNEEMFINATKDMAMTIGDNSEVKIGGNHTHDIAVNHDVTIGSNHLMGITGDQSVSVGAAESLSVSGNRQTNIAGADSQTIGAARIASISDDKSTDADAGRTLTVGAAMLEVAAMSISRATLGATSVTVGGAWISAAAVGLGNATAGAGAETVGAVKLQLGGGGVSTGVKGALAQTIGGATISNAGGDAGEGSGGAMAVTVGGAMLANSPTITIEADSEIKVTVGGSTLTISSSSIEIKSPSLASPGATIDKEGSVIHHNP